MKSILMSIRPKWVEKIASGEKTVEVRKSVPKCGAPFKVYMYMTRHKWVMTFLRKIGAFRLADKLECGFGKVVGEFICDKICDFLPYKMYDGRVTFHYNVSKVKKETCLSGQEFCDYLGDKCGYGLHISDLKIYDKPKDITDFTYHKKCRACKGGNRELRPTCDFYDENCEYPVSLERPPQSWCYVESLVE